VNDYEVPPFSLHISGGGGDDVVKVPTLYPGEYSIQAGLILHQVYVPEKRHANRSQNSHLKQYFVGVGD